MLTALAAGESHSFQIEQQMIADVGGVVQLIYRVPDTHPVRYRLTPRGRKILIAERGQALAYYKLLQDRL